jgi:predicted transcriptional regulator
MSIKKIDQVNRETLKMFIISNDMSIVEFAKRYKININSFYRYVAGDVTLRKINLKVAKILKDNGVDPFTPVDLPEISEETKLKLAGCEY